MEKIVWDHKEEFSSMINEVVKDNSNLITTLKGYTDKIEKFAAGQRSEEKANKLKGDMFEILAAIFFHRMGDSPRVGLNKYKIVEAQQDYGVDGIGINANNTTVAVQVKYRSNPADLITYSDISKTFSAGIIRHKIDLNVKNSIYVFTNSVGVTAPCKEVFGERLVVINRNIIESELDNNKLFWENFIRTLYDIFKN